MYIMTYNDASKNKNVVGRKDKHVFQKIFILLKDIITSNFFHRMYRNVYTISKMYWLSNIRRTFSMYQKTLYKK